MNNTIYITQIASLYDFLNKTMSTILSSSENRIQIVNKIYSTSQLICSLEEKYLSNELSDYSADLELAHFADDIDGYKDKFNELTNYLFNILESSRDNNIHYNNKP